jgi:uncharacterized protein YjbJ (UPF0337 family)
MKRAAGDRTRDRGRPNEGEADKAGVIVEDAVEDEKDTLGGRG